MTRPWAYVCRRCDHLATVHRGTSGGWKCRLCECVGTKQADFSEGISESVARAQYGTSLAYLAREFDRI